MHGYRFYLLTPAHRIDRARDAECEDDANALAHARSLRHPNPVEVWEGRRKVGVVEPQGRAQA